MIPYWRMSEDEKFNWALQEYNIRAHEVELIRWGKATLDAIAKSTAQRRMRVQLTSKEAEIIVEWMSNAISEIKFTGNGNEEIRLITSSKRNKRVR